MAEKQWRKVNPPHLEAVVQAGIRFPDEQTRILLNMSKSSDSFINQPVEVAA